MNTQSDRTAISQEEFSLLENLMPIGPGNLQTVPDVSPILHDYGADIIYHTESCNLNNTEYLINFATNGLVFAYDVVAQTSAQIGTGLSGSGSRSAQWKNSILLFIDANGYYFWDPTGPTFAQITGTGVPTSGVAIAVYAGRVWIFSGRLIYTGDVDDYTAPAFLPANGARVTNLTDPTLRSNVTNCLAANGYLYYWGNTSINVISNVQIPPSASPPAPIWDDLNIHPTVGTDQPTSLFVLNRTVMFATRYGAYGMDGVSAQRVSMKLDGTWKQIDFSQTISGGVVTLNNILCAAFLIKWNDPVQGTRTVMPILFDKKWVLGNMGGAVTHICSSVVDEEWQLFGFEGNKLRQLFQDDTSHAAARWSTALWPMEDALLTKQATASATEYVASNPGGMLTASVDSEQGPEPIDIEQQAFITFVNQNQQPLIFVNNASAVLNFVVSGYVLAYKDASNWGKYVGLSGASTKGLAYQLTGLHLEYKLRARF